ncbi:class V chitinase-like [Papaver somniferum]|uniref:class V chitinase-like n=1 Tax=Papaver somniferum TaxID=3469 RepID=UPI000E6F55C8|nr:class V chitinase-like [Papaver somniferum]
MFASTSAVDIKGGYWPSWLQNTLPPSDIPASYYTHVFYAFVQNSPQNYRLVLKPEDEQWMPVFTTSLQSKTPRITTMLSIGGGNQRNRAYFAAMAGSPSNRANFISSTIQEARRYNFEGLDLDWEYPLTQAAMVNLGTLLTEWRKAINEEAGRTGKPRLLLTACLLHAKRLYPIKRAYHIPGASST